MTIPPLTVVTRRSSLRDILIGLAAAQKRRAPGAPAYSIYVNRPAGRFLAAIAYRAGLSPNGVTAISGILSLMALILLVTVPPTWWSGFVIAGLLASGYAFDSADGQVARLRGGGSPAGEWLDHVVDAAKTASIHLAVLICAYRFMAVQPDTLLLIPIGYAIVNSVAFFAMILNDLLKAIHGKPTSSRVSTPLRSVLLLPTDYGVLCLIFLLLGWPPVFLLAYSLMFAANATHLGLTLVKWFGDMKKLGHSVSTNV